MTQLEVTGRETDPSREEQPWHERGPGSEWEAETDVMPPEYCQQLLRISRQLQKNGR
jgi:hypothetical protein